MKKINSNLIIIVLFIVFLVAPIEEAYRFMLIAIVPLILSIKNAVILRNQIFYNISHKKFNYFEKKFGTKKGFIIYSLLLVVVPLFFAIVLVVTGIGLL